MMALGLFVLLVGGMALIGGLIQRMRAGRLGETPFAPTGQIAAQGRGLASPKGAISTQGAMHTQQVLTSAVSGAPCVYYKMRLEAEWTENNAEQKYTVLEDTQAVPFAVNDGSGPAVVSIDAKTGGEFCTTKPFERKKFSRGLLAAMGSKPLEVTPRFAIPASVQVRDALGRMIDVPTTASFFVSEEFLEPKGLVYVNGKLRDDGSIGSPDWTSLLVLDKSRDELLANTTGFAKKLLIGGGLATPVGVILAVVGHLTAPPEPPAAEQTMAVVAPPEGTPQADASAGGAGSTRPLVSGLTAEGGCSALDLNRGTPHIQGASEGVNMVSMEGTTLQRMFVKLGSVSPGATVDVCALGRRCTQLLQVGVGSSTFVNDGRHTAGTITVGAYDIASGRMDLTFRGVTLTRTGSDERCVVNGSLTTTGFTM